MGDYSCDLTGKLLKFATPCLFTCPRSFLAKPLTAY